MYSRTFSGAIFGMEGRIVKVEADVCDGLPLFSMVGFLGSEVKEARERVRIALKNFGYRLPPKHITINLSPADMRKEGTVFDLSIALGILGAMGYVSQDNLENTLFMGELSLDGKVNPVNGTLPMVYGARESGFARCVVPKANAMEGCAVEGIEVIGVDSLFEAVEYLMGRKHIEPARISRKELLLNCEYKDTEDFRDVTGQRVLKRAIEVAVSGMHHMLMMGPPGVGKTMIARCIPAIMPGLSFEESMEITKLYSISGLLKKEQYWVARRPFRAPHHTITPAALIGGGLHPKAGEVSLASKGVLFLDELAEFTKSTLELLRQPLEDKKVTISRNFGSFDYPADFMLVGAMNPCRCGYYPDRTRCRCTEADVARYMDKLSGPLLDRMDICAEALPVGYGDLAGKREEEDSKAIRERVKAARDIQLERYKDERIYFNGNLLPAMVKQYCNMKKQAKDLLETVFEKERLSARAYHKLLKVARTVADLDGSIYIEEKHLSESIFYRIKDKNGQEDI